ncbi:hypothetical protein OUZ56_006981 [Daphnia magna]|uniref:Uncharacterized protein n=1 Tax=Daphnia magna TaxID=35525 RepID=A0ABQ9YXB0_9CRUS|nr:hypothetical protein OUZ56_006981 [Daphnia magna]
MALVLLPCDLPTWPTLQRHLTAMKREVRTAGQLKDALLKIYNLCNVYRAPQPYAYHYKKTTNQYGSIIDCGSHNENIETVDWKWMKP